MISIHPWVNMPVTVLVDITSPKYKRSTVMLDNYPEDIEKTVSDLAVKAMMEHYSGVMSDKR